MAAVVIPFASADDVCPRCCRPVRLHRVGGVWVGCHRDVAVGRDDPATVAARQARLAQLQTRVLKVQPWAIDLAEDA
jgi:hypothetical protein